MRDIVMEIERERERKQRETKRERDCIIKKEKWKKK